MLDPFFSTMASSACVRGVGAQFPALPIEGNPLDGIKIDAVEAAGMVAMFLSLVPPEVVLSLTYYASV